MSWLLIFLSYNRRSMGLTREAEMIELQIKAKQAGAAGATPIVSGIYMFYIINTPKHK